MVKLFMIMFAVLVMSTATYLMPRRIPASAIVTSVA